MQHFCDGVSQCAAHFWLINSGKNGKLNGFGNGAAPQVQIRRVLYFYQILSPEKRNLRHTFRRFHTNIAPYGIRSPPLMEWHSIRNSTPFCTPPETPLNGPADPAGCSPATRVPLGTFPLPWGISSDQKRARAGAAPGPLQPGPMSVWRYRAPDPHRLVTERSHDPGPLWHDA